MNEKHYPSYTDAVRGEVTDKLKNLAHFEPSYTEAHVQYLAQRLIVPRSNGTFSGSSDPGELYRLVVELGIVQNPEPITCPVPWCAGSAYEHDPRAFSPDEFEHSPRTEHTDRFAPHGMLFGEFYQVGNTSPFYELHSDPPPRSKTLLTVSEVRALADDFERHAATLRERATQLEELGGMQ